MTGLSRAELAALSPSALRALIAPDGCVNGLIRLSSCASARFCGRVV